MGSGISTVASCPIPDANRKFREKTLPTGQFDGIIPLADGGLLVASQLGKNVYRVSATGEITELAKEIPVPAAIGYDTKRNRLLIPQIALSSVTMVDLP